MKKIIALLLTIVLALSIVACGAKTPEAPAEDNTPVVDDTPDTEEVVTPEADAPAADSASVAQTLVSEFKTLAADGSKTTQELADALAASQALSEIGVITMPYEDTFLPGFDNFEVQGFTECVTFAPMIGTIPFIGYVFTVGDGVDASAFAADLEANANLRWNICVAADEAASAVEGNKVMFVMSPISFAAEEPSDMVQDEFIDGEMGMTDELPAFDGEMAE